MNPKNHQILYLFKEGDRKYTKVKVQISNSIPNSESGIKIYSDKSYHDVLHHDNIYYSHDGYAYRVLFQLDNIVFESLDTMYLPAIKESIEPFRFDAEGTLTGSLCFPSFTPGAIVCLDNGYYRIDNYTAEVRFGIIQRVVRNDIPIEFILDDIYNAIVKVQQPPQVSQEVLESLRNFSSNNNGSLLD